MIIIIIISAVQILTHLWMHTQRQWSPMELIACYSNIYNVISDWNVVHQQGERNKERAWEADSARKGCHTGENLCQVEEQESPSSRLWGSASGIHNLWGEILIWAPDGEEEEQVTPRRTGEVSPGCDTNVIKVRQQVDTFQSELETELQQKTLLQKHCEELQVAYSLSQEKSRAEFQGKRERNFSKTNWKRHKFQTRRSAQGVKLMSWPCDSSLTPFSASLRRKLSLTQTRCQKAGVWSAPWGLSRVPAVKRWQRRSISCSKTSSRRRDCLSLSPPQKIDRREDEPCRMQESLPTAPTIKPLKEAQATEEKPCMQQESITNAPALESMDWGCSSMHLFISAALLLTIVKTTLCSNVI